MKYTIIYFAMWKAPAFDLDLTKRHNEGVMKLFAAIKVNAETVFNTHLLVRNCSTCKPITRVIMTLSFEGMIKMYQCFRIWYALSSTLPAVLAMFSFVEPRCIPSPTVQLSSPGAGISDIWSYRWTCHEVEGGDLKCLVNGGGVHELLEGNVEMNVVYLHKNGEKCLIWVFRSFFHATKAQKQPKSVAWRRNVTQRGVKSGWILILSGIKFQKIFGPKIAIFKWLLNMLTYPNSVKFVSLNWIRVTKVTKCVTLLYCTVNWNRNA